LVFEVAFTQSAAEDFAYFGKTDQRLILEAIEEQLSYEPLTTTRNRKQLRDNPVASWALRVGEFRVFYEASADEETVSVRAVGRKDRNILFIRGMRITL
jgi:mRNA-degrading endonuclease RelE of RelBE toxin-antitoxin system